MPILSLLKRARANIAAPPHPLFHEPHALRTAYLTGLAMQAYADGNVSEQEQALFLELAGLFEMEPEEAHALLLRSAQPAETVVREIRDCLIYTKHKYYFVLDLQIMALQDNNLGAVESEVLQIFRDLLELTPEDCAFLIDLANAVYSGDEKAKAEWTERFGSSKELAKETSVEAFDYYTSNP